MIATASSLHDSTVISADFGIDPLELHVLNPEKYPFLLESTAAGTAQGRFDILFAFPERTVRLDSGAAGQRDFLAGFDDAWRSEKLPVVNTGHLPFSGGWFVLLAYELAGQIEPRLELPVRIDSPVALAVRIRAALIRDRHTCQAWIVAEPGAQSLAAELAADCRQLPACKRSPRPLLEGALVEPDGQAYIDSVEAAREYIARGDIFQANLSREWRARLAPGIRAADVYRRLRQHNPAPFSGLAVCGEHAVISSSPERLFRISGDRID
ncbi:MAG TPA: aminodeoxychorismate synthase, component I, partial [Chromatiales bacterium]|nr:aminodeoxychorismate synthase, component I [Chromatiales bacterium]